MARRTLTREKVLRAAVDLADADGLEALSMRRLAAVVGGGWWWRAASRT